MDDAVCRDELFAKTGFALPKTSGSSMRPLIWGEDHCVVVTRLDGEPTRGDLLMFSQTMPGGERKNIVHRLVEIRDGVAERLYVMRGDNCLGSETVRREDIIGRVAEVHRLSGWRWRHAIGRRQFAVTDRDYRVYSRVWMWLWPVRRLVYRARAVMAACRRRVRV